MYPYRTKSCRDQVAGPLAESEGFQFESSWVTFNPHLRFFSIDIPIDLILFSNYESMNFNRLSR